MLLRRRGLFEALGFYDLNQAECLSCSDTFSNTTNEGRLVVYLGFMYSLIKVRGSLEKLLILFIHSSCSQTWSYKFGFLSFILQSVTDV